MKRLIQVIRYGLKHASMIAEGTGQSRLRVFVDVLFCFFKYKMWSNEYLKERVYLLSKDERVILYKKYQAAGIKRDEWQKEFVRNRKFISRYSSIKYECGYKRIVRNKKYTTMFSAGKNLFVEYGVDIYRQHYLDGMIQIGDNVIIGKGCLIDYSGTVVIGNNVSISERSIILSHEHNIEGLQMRTETRPIQKKTEIKDFAWIGAGTTILPGRVIGEHAVVGAGSVVAQDIKPYDIVAGNPAKSIK